MLHALNVMNLLQLVIEPTHKHGHTLDRITTRQSLVKFINEVYNDLQISYHYGLSFRIEI